MKTSLLLLFICSFAFGQIKEMKTPEKVLIGSHKEMGTEYIKIERWDENLIFVLYKDMNYQIAEYKSFEFEDQDGAFDTLYNKLIEGISSGEKSESSLELPNHILRLKFDKSFGKSFVEIYVQNKNIPSIIGKMLWLDEKRVNKIFGKQQEKKKK